MKYSFCFITLLLFTISTLAQKKVIWNDLANVTYTEKYFPSWGDYFLYPNFGNTVKNLEGKQITITGYFIDIDPKGKLFVLSKEPMASCFFCGGSGPETAIEIQFKNKQHFKTDDVITCTGVLKLNADDVEHFNYILIHASATLKR